MGDTLGLYNNIHGSFNRREIKYTLRIRLFSLIFYLFRMLAHALGVRWIYVWWLFQYKKHLFLVTGRSYWTEIK